MKKLNEQPAGMEDGGEYNRVRMLVILLSRVNCGLAITSNC